MDQRRRLWELLGRWDIAFAPPETVSTTETATARLTDLTFPTSDGQTVPATLAIPLSAQGRIPAVLWCHAHGNRYDVGRKELAEGRPALVSPPLEDLIAQGFAVLCLDMPTFGPRAEPGESARSKALLWQGRTLFGRMLAELIAAIDYLSDHPAIDPGRIAAAGISMGATHAFWLAALDSRIRATVHMCAFSDLATLIETGAHDAHGIYMTVPGLIPQISTGKLAGLAAPRAQLACVGLLDAFTRPETFAPARAELVAAYAAAPEMLEFHVSEDTGHTETPAMRAHWLDFLRRHLNA